MQGEQLAEPEAGAACDQEERCVLLIDPHPLPLGLCRVLGVLVASLAAVQARSGNVRYGPDLLGLEGLDWPGSLLGALGGLGDRVVAKPEGVGPARVLEDRVQDLAVDVDGASADPFAIDLAQEAMDVLRRNRGELAAAELPHDPRAVPFVTSLLGPGEQASVAGESGGLGPLLEFEVFEPEVDGVLEARFTFWQSNFLLGFNLRDQLTHLPVGALLVEEAIANSPAAFPPASLGVWFQPRSAESALVLPPRRVPPLRFVKGRALVGPHDQGAGLS